MLLREKIIDATEKCTFKLLNLENFRVILRIGKRVIGYNPVKS